MVYFEYRVLIVYLDFTNEYKTRSFDIYAKSVNHAKKIATEMLYITDGNIPEDDVQYVVKYITPTIKASGDLVKFAQTSYKYFAATCAEWSYSKFVESISEMEGYQVKFGADGKIKEFLFDSVRSEDTNHCYTYKMCYNDNKCFIDNNFIICTYKQHTYLITEAFDKLLKCKLA